MVQDSQVARWARGAGILSLMWMLAACSDGSGQQTLNDSMDYAERTTEGAWDKSMRKATSPLRDLGLIEDDIPEMLQALSSDPYTPVKSVNCKALKQEVHVLDSVLGPDLEVRKRALAAKGDDKTYLSMGLDAGADFAQGTVVDLVAAQTDILPFRGLIRKISGAEEHEKAIAEAQEAGKLRRAYIKGIASARYGSGCSLTEAVIAANATPPAPSEAEK